MRVLLAAIGFKNGDLEYNKNKILDTITAYKDKADLLVFGETFLQGFDSLNWDYEHDSKIAVSVTDPAIQAIRKQAEECSVAVSFGYIEYADGVIFSSQMTIGADGQMVDNYRRISEGWKEESAGSNYQEGQAFHAFEYRGIKYSVALCGDLWHEQNIEPMRSLRPDVVLWPVYTDFNYQEWNSQVKYEYAEQAAKLGTTVLYVNSVCLDKDGDEIARGGAAYFQDGIIQSEVPAGKENTLLVTI